MNTMKITFLAFLLAFSTACVAQTPNPETPNPLVNDSVALEQCTAQELEAIVLPEWLTGSLTLVFADGDGGCYYGEIEL